MRHLMLNMLENLLQVMAACAMYLAARWLLDISTPQKDLAELRTWELFRIDTKWYRGLEYMHQIRARNLLNKETPE